METMRQGRLHQPRRLHGILTMHGDVSSSKLFDSEMDDSVDVDFLQMPDVLSDVADACGARVRPFLGQSIDLLDARTCVLKSLRHGIVPRRGNGERRVIAFRTAIVFYS